MYLSNIKKRNLSALQQVAERYAIMAVEVFEQKLATDFKSISYSYNGDNDDGCGRFCAEFVPFGSDTDKESHNWLLVIFYITAVPNEDLWVLSQGAIKSPEGGAKIFFTPNSGLLVRESVTPNKCFVGNGSNAKIYESFPDIETSDTLIT